MILRAFKVVRNEFDEFQSEGVIGKSAIIMDAQNDIAAVISIDEVEIEGVAFSRTQGIFQVQLNVGGRDIGKRFHQDLRYQPGLCSWSRQQSLQFWEKYNLGSIKMIDFDIVKQWLHDENAVERTARDIWLLPNIESKLINEIDGSIISDFRKQPKQRPRPIPVMP